MPKVIQVIESETTRGEGTPADPARFVTQYHTLDGKLLWENDPRADCLPRPPLSDLFLSELSDEEIADMHRRAWGVSNARRTFRDFPDPIVQGVEARAAFAEERKHRDAR